MYTSKKVSTKKGAPVGKEGVRKNRSLFAKERERKELERAEFERMRNATLFEEQARMEEEQRKGEEERLASEARHRAEQEEARRRELEEAREGELAALMEDEAHREAQLAANAAEHERLAEEAALRRGEMTYALASVPVNRMRPFFFFAQSHATDVRKFLQKEESLQLTLCTGGGAVLGTAAVPFAQLAQQMDLRREYHVNFMTEGLQDVHLKVSMGLSMVRAVAYEHLQLKPFREGIYLNRDWGWCPCEPLPHSWMVASPNQSESEEERIERGAQHELARRQIDRWAGLMAEAAALGAEEGEEGGQPFGARLAQPKPAHPHRPISPSRRGPKQAVALGHIGQGKFVATWSGAGMGTNIRRRTEEIKTPQITRQSAGHVARERREMQGLADAGARAREQDRPAYWRCTAELLHVAGLETKYRDMRVGVSLRLLGHTMCTPMVAASPPITLLDSYHKVYFKARESNLRRYFFASPRLFASLVVEPLQLGMAQGDEAEYLSNGAEHGHGGRSVAVEVGKGVVDVNDLFKLGMLESDVDIPVIGERKPARVHLALFLERVGQPSATDLMASVQPAAAATHTGASVPVPRVCLGRDIGFNVRPLELRGASVPSLDISAASQYLGEPASAN